jgi:hypothetical protein
MRWFDRASGDGAQRAKFADVSPGQRRIPSWVPGRGEVQRAESSLRPPRLPSEFVDAVRHEIGEVAHARGHAPEVQRRSEYPRHSQAVPAPSIAPASAPGAALEAGAAVVSAAVYEPDPALFEGIERAVMELATERERVLSETAGQIAELAVMIARRVIGRELTLDPGIVRGLVREGISALGQHDRVLVRLGEGFAASRERLEDDLRASETRCEVRFDPALEPYGCVVETELGQVDESIETRMETLLAALRPDTES